MDETVLRPLRGVGVVGRREAVEGEVMEDVRRVRGLRGVGEKGVVSTTK